MGKQAGDETPVKKIKKQQKQQVYLALVIFESSLTCVQVHMKDPVRLCGYDISMVKLPAYTYS